MESRSDQPAGPLSVGQAGPGDLAQQLDQALAEVYSLHELAKLLASSIELGQVVGYILDGLCGLMGTESSFLYGYEPGPGNFKLLGAHGPVGELPAVVPDKASHWIIQAAQSLNPVVLTIGDLALAVTALRSHDALQGLVGIGTRASRQFTPAELERLAASSHLAAMALESARLYARIQTLAVTDGLTGLYNHRHFYEELHREIARARRHNTPLSLLMLDIDHFKVFNDTFGHVRGDQVLRLVTGILQRSIRDTDLAARYGGEEFAVILPDTGPAEACRVAERIRQRMAEATFPGQATITVSIGVASLVAQETAPALVRRADQALYRAKQAGRNRVCLNGELDAQDGGQTPAQFVAT